MSKRLELELFILCGALWLVVSCAPKPPATRDDRLKWNLAALTNSYASAGHQNPKWDADAQAALTAFARSKTATEDEALVLTELAGSVAENAISAGCDDPMVRYLKVRYGMGASPKALTERKESYRVVASNLESSAYSPLPKFYANVEAAELLYANHDANAWPLVRQIRSQALGDLNQAYQDKTLPEAEAYQAAGTLFQMLSRNTRELTNAYDILAATLSANGSKPAVGALVKAEFYVKYAWCGRGNGTADQVTEEGWRLFRDRLAEAEKALNRAWALNPYDAQIPIVMMSVALGQEKPRSEMETWFQRAMKLDRNNYQACHAKLHFLLPQWNGSREDMLEFGRQCVASTNWGASVPMILVNAHSEFARTLPADSRQDYWTQPDVWPDIKAAYEKYARNEPDATRFRYPYAAYAFRCGQWDDFNEQIEHIRQNDGNLNDVYFGGQVVFEQMLALAKRHGVSVPGKVAAPAKPAGGE